MAERPKGNIYYEILIAVLAIVLILTILYPTKVWKSEDETAKVCHTRMEAIQSLEIRYIALNEEYIYTDSLSKLRDVVLTDASASAYLDSVIGWDGLVSEKELSTIIAQRQLPEDIRILIRDKVAHGEPLGNLTRWDSLGDRLVDQLEMVLKEADITVDNPLDSAIAWQSLARGNDFYQILDSTDVRNSIRNRTRLAAREGRPIIETSGWKYFKPNFYKYLENTIHIAQRDIVWNSDKKDDWQDAKEKEFTEELNSLSQGDKDTLWVQLQRKIWDKEKGVIWRKMRKNLWKEEQENWMADNEITWGRILRERWVKERKQKWNEDTKKTLKSLPFELEESPDSTDIAAQDTTIIAEIDTTVIDSAWVYHEIFNRDKNRLWRSVVDTLHVQEFDNWKRKNKNEIDGIVQDLWTSARRISWEEDYYPGWLTEQESNKDKLWDRIVEEKWILEKDILWERELESGAEQRNALRRLDNTIEWNRVLDHAWLVSIIDELQLPDTRGVLKALKKEDKEAKSGLYNLGLVGLYREVLLDSITECPFAHAPYLIQTVDTMAVKEFIIQCPIQETYIVNEAKGDSTKKIATIRIDPVTKEKTKSVMGISLIKKLLGGGKLESHGVIETDKKSWEKKGT